MTVSTGFVERFIDHSRRRLQRSDTLQEVD
jgi:hypothetical protein